ncbi:MAG TPA: ribulose-phosphate 3-epimerase, partial [Algoriphagus sp.]|nr:ribulose-phosphate 3-epimerase [Algoriphagus sp.]
KVSRLKEMIDTKGSETLIEIDGGVNLDNAPKLMEAGADVLVAGSFVFNSSNPKETISELKNI